MLTKVYFIVFLPLILLGMFWRATGFAFQWGIEISRELLDRT